MQVALEEARDKETFRARATLILMGVGLVFILIMMSLNMVNLVMMANGGMDETGQLVLDLLVGLTGLIYLLIYVINAVFYCMWLYRAHWNVQLFGRESTKTLTTSPGWVIGFYFIPILSLFRPYQAMVQLWKASDPEVKDWEQAPGSWMVGLWWFFWLASNLANNASFRLSMSAHNRESLMSAELVSLLANTLDVGLYVVAFFLVRAIHHRQLACFENLKRASRLQAA